MYVCDAPLFCDAPLWRWRNFCRRSLHFNLYLVTIIGFAKTLAMGIGITFVYLNRKFFANFFFFDHGFAFSNNHCQFCGDVSRIVIWPRWCYCRRGNCVCVCVCAHGFCNGSCCCRNQWISGKQIYGKSNCDSNADGLVLDDGYNRIVTVFPLSLFRDTINRCRRSKRHLANSVGLHFC